MIGEDVSYTLSTSQDQTMFQPIPMKSDTTIKGGEPGDPAYTLRRGGDGGTHDEVAYKRGGGYVVRRLTPLECERLQGFPDGYTDIPYKGKEHPPDGPRYKALGNSFAVPVVRWIGERIQMVEDAAEDGGR